MAAIFANKLVLTIDDSDTIRAYLKTVLSPLGAEVDGAATGQQGVEKCRNAQYDLILLDLILPDADGIEILQQIRAKDTASTIVMLTGHGGIKSAISAVQLGADGYLQKQDMTATVHDHAEFLYSLKQALERRAGLVAQEQLETMRADFYAMVTHDLRNPAGIIQGALEMLAEEDTGELTSSQEELVTIAGKSVSKMLRLINDYLDFAKIDAGYLRLDRENVDLGELVSESTRLALLQARVRRQTLTLDLPSEPLWAFADAERLEQVLDNLLSNACKYTPDGGSITVRLRAEGDQAVFQVSDSGIGIPPEQIPALFAKYQRVSGKTTRGIRGTGLGLLIVKEIVEAHGGSIRVESEGVSGHGTRFIFNIPIGQSDQTPEPVESDQSETQYALAAPGDEDAEFYQVFLRETQAQVSALRDTLNRLDQTPTDQSLIETAQRATHTLKGNAGAMQFNAIQDLAAQMDDILRQAVHDNSALTSDNVAGLTLMVDQIADLLTDGSNATIK